MRRISTILKHAVTALLASLLISTPARSDPAELEALFEGLKTADATAKTRNASAIVLSIEYTDLVDRSFTTGQNGGSTHIPPSSLKNFQ